MRILQFKQKTPGFGISKSFYLTVLAATAQLPAIEEIVSPRASGGAVEGYGVPLAANARKDDRFKPIERGVYAFASKSRQTLLRAMVMPKEEAAYDPHPFLRSKEAGSLSAEHLSRIAATWSLIQMTFETHESMVYDSLKFLLQICARVAELTQGVVSDPICRTYRLPNEMFHSPPLNEKVDARDHVRVLHVSERSWSYTLGLQKFALPEIEVFGVSDGLSSTGERFLIGVAQAVLMGRPLEVGRTLGSAKCSLQIASGGLDRAQWEGIPCFELIPLPGRTSAEAIAAWADSI